MSVGPTGYSTLRTWRADPLLAASTSISAAVTMLDGAPPTVLTATAQLDSGWHGPAAAEAHEGYALLQAALHASTEGLRAVAATVASAAEQVQIVEGLVMAVERAAWLHGFQVDEVGMVVDSTPLPGLASSADPASVLAAFSAARQREADRLAVQRLVAQAMAVAEEVDETTAQLLAEINPPDASHLPSRGLAPAVPASGTPYELGGWWAGLSTQQREQVIVEHPAWVGAADGLPAWARDRANRLRLTALEAPLVAELAELDRAPVSGADVGSEAVSALVGPMFPRPGDTVWARRERVAARLSSVRQVQAVLARDDGVVRQLLVLDTNGDLATAAVTTGDVDRAGHVAVFVGGLGTTVDGTLAGHDTELTHLVELATHQSQRSGDGGAVAAVTWLGYQAPQWADTFIPQRSTATFGSARTGAPALRSLLAGLDESRRGDRPHVTVVAHSYGSVVAGVALAEAPRRLPVDDLVVFGSPGIDVTREQQLLLPPGRLHVLEAHDDPVADLGRFGADPDTIPGADVLSAQGAGLPDGRNGLPSSLHSDYLVDGTTSQWNVAAIVAGTPCQTVSGTGGFVPSIYRVPFIGGLAWLPP